MSARSRGGVLSRVGGVLGPLLLLGVGVYLIVYGAHVFGVEHYGTPAQVKILAGCHSPVGSHAMTCPAAWIQADGTGIHDTKVRIRRISPIVQSHSERLPGITFTPARGAESVIERQGGRQSAG